MSANFAGTLPSREVCEKIADQTEGVTLLAFSRGKDSLASWLYLRQFFDTIIPYTCIHIPGLEFVERSLKYYEDWFETKIHRVLYTNVGNDIAWKYFQLPGDYEHIDRTEFIDYPMTYLENLLMQHHGLDFEDYWTAHGFSRYDSLDRQGWVKKCGGIHKKTNRFFPCWDWKPTEIRSFIEQQQPKISLPEDYLFTNRSLEATPGWKNLRIMRETHPEDYRRCEFWFPLIGAQVARQVFREAHFAGDNNDD